MKSMIPIGNTIKIMEPEKENHRILKMALPKEDIFEFELPRGFSILKIGIRDNEPTIWYTVPENDYGIQKLKWQFVGTGHYIVPEKVQYLSTLETAGGEIVHLFSRLD